MTKATTDYILPNEFFRHMKLRPKALQPFGFVKRRNGWEYSLPIAGGALVCTISIGADHAITEKIVDEATGDEYVQHRIAEACGKFVGRVRQDMMSLMERIAATCFERDVFKTELARGIIETAQTEWSEEPEFLWEKFPDYAVLRRKDTNKWYALVARLPSDKVGDKSNELIEIVNLRRTVGMEGLRFLPAYHMNKKTWTTIVLDGMMPLSKIVTFLVASRNEAKR